jgi:hypothetical protein
MATATARPTGTSDERSLSWPGAHLGAQVGAHLGAHNKGTLETLEHRRSGLGRYVSGTTRLPKTLLLYETKVPELEIHGTGFRVLPKMR